MPTIFDPKDLPVAETGGIHTTTLANSTLLGTNALAVQRIHLAAGASTPAFEPAAVERFIYVIRGEGRARVGEQVFPLAAESVLWLEVDDAFFLEAGASGLEVLLCRAPASE